MTSITININGVSTQVPAGAVAYKHADPTEGARWLYEAGEAQDIAHQDPSLIVWTTNRAELLADLEAGTAERTMRI